MILLDGLIVTNGSANFSRLSSDVVTAYGDTTGLIGLAIVGAIIVGLLYAIYLLLTQGN
jgi:hypothetical protein